LTRLVLPESSRRAFITAQRIVLQLKVDEARRAVLPWATGAALVIGAVPIPVPDAIPLAALQVAMFARIAVVMGIDLSDKTVRNLLGRFTLSSTGIAVTAGKSAAGILLKLVPVVGSTINAGIAAALTAALGESFILVCAEILRRRDAGLPMAESEMFDLLLDGFRRRYMAGKDRPAGAPHLDSQ
jgi:uncharacterized protein (DUF697 family)